MRILVTNDDGIHAPGLDVCAEIARALSDDVWVVAPEYDQSGVSHSLSLNDPLRLREVGERRFAVKGTPTDCVIMGARHILKDAARPRAVRRQSRPQRRRGRDLFRHGRRRDRRRRCSAFRPSRCRRPTRSRSAQPPHWETAIQHGPDIIRRVLDAGIPRDVLVNINFPDCAPDEVKGIAVAAQGTRPGAAADRGAPRRPRQSLLLDRLRAHARPPPADGTDISALADNRIAVTPLRLDLTDEPFMTKLAELFGCRTCDQLRRDRELRTAPTAAAPLSPSAL